MGAVKLLLAVLAFGYVGKKVVPNMSPNEVMICMAIMLAGFIAHNDD